MNAINFIVENSEKCIIKKFYLQNPTIHIFKILHVTFYYNVTEKQNEENK